MTITIGAARFGLSLTSIDIDIPRHFSLYARVRRGDRWPANSRKDKSGARVLQWRGLEVIVEGRQALQTQQARAVA